MIVETFLGKVRGRLENGVHAFKGIPYAASTEATNRFLPPQPALPWAGIREAETFGKSSPQVHVESPLTRWYGAIEPIGEDCLSLNVFTPVASTSASKPVMVWLHGGGWWVYSGSAPGLNGTNLAKFGDVVVVTVNHRLGLFGYIKLDDADDRFADSGSAGVLDLVAALRWVGDNIAAFGGDPANVTVFGHSGGGAKVSTLMATPAAKGLFHKAIAQSCSGSLRHAGQEEAAAMTRGLSSQLGLSRPTGEALQAVPLDRLLAAYARASGFFRPIIDGRALTRDPFDPDAPALSSAIPFMVGNTAAETRLTLAGDRRNFFLDSEEVHRRIGRFLRVDARETSRIVDAYQTAAPVANPSDILAAVTTDYAYIRNTRREATLQADAGGGPVYAYLFNWRTPAWDGLLQSPHTAEVPFVFGTAPAAAELVGSGVEIASLTRMMIATWSAFARTGSPGNPTVPFWPQYNSKDRFTMLLDVRSHVEPDPGGVTRASLDRLPFFEYRMPQNYAQPSRASTGAGPG